MNLKKVIDALRSYRLLQIYASLLAIVAGLLVGLLILLFINPSQAFPAFNSMLFAGFRRGLTSFGNVIYFATPIILTGLSVGFAFKTGLFNIGATGQMMIGGFIAVLIGVRFAYFGPFTWVVAVIGAGLAGAMWGIIPGLLKAFKGVHEVVTTIMMNYIALFLVNFSVKRTVYDSLNNRSLPVPSDNIIPKFGLDTLFPRSNIQGGFWLAIFAAIVVFFILNKTVFGFELKAVGFNKNASKYAGISEKKRIVNAMMVAGALAGVAGSVLYLSDSMTFINVRDILPTQGFMGISVALLGLKEPLGIFLAGLFFGYLQLGGQTMQLFDFAPEVIEVMTGMIVYFSALSLIFGKLAVRVFRLREEGEEA